MNDDYPSLDVIIPLFNNASYIAEAIQSIIDQAYPGITIIVVDDGSTDGGEKIAANFAEVKLVKQAPKGAGAARNLGVKHAESEFLAFLDADDRWLNGSLKPRMDLLLSEPKNSMIFGGMSYFYSPELRPEEYPHKPDDEAEGYMMGTMLIRRLDFKQVGTLSEQLVVGEFIAWYGRAKAAGLTEIIYPKTVLQRRLHANNHTRKSKASNADYLQLLRSKLKAERSGTP